jgi:hypothetical protein
LCAFWHILGSRFFLVGQPIGQRLIGGRHGHHIRRAILLSHLDQLGERLWRHGPQAGQQLFILRCSTANQNMHRDIPGGRELPSAKALADSGNLIDQFIFLKKVHASPRLSPSWHAASRP